MWLYNDIEFKLTEEEYVGFVYLITNLTNNKKYIGKKNFYFSKSKQVKGKKKKIKVESDWISYFGSNKELIDDVAALGEHNFKREILKLCTAKSEFSYYEAKYQFQYDVLLHPEEWYNSWISVRVTRKHLSRFIEKRCLTFS